METKEIQEIQKIDVSQLFQLYKSKNFEYSHLQKTKTNEFEKLLKINQDILKRLVLIESQLKNVETHTNNHKSDIDTYISKKHASLITVIDLVSQSQDQLTEYIQAIRLSTTNEIAHLHQKQKQKALGEVVKQKKVMSEIINLGQELPYDKEEGINLHIGTYSEVLDKLHRYLYPLHHEYELHKKLNETEKHKTYKALLESFTTQYLNINTNKLKEPQKLLLAENTFEDIHYFLALSKKLATISYEFTKILPELKDSNRTGIMGFIDEL